MVKSLSMTRSDAKELVNAFTDQLRANMSDSYALGYLEQTIVELIMNLEPKKRNEEIAFLTRALERERAYATNKKDAA